MGLVDMLLAELVATSGAVSATRGRRDKIAALAGCLRAMDDDELPVGARYLAGQTRQERLNVGWRTVHGTNVAPAEEPRLALLEVDATLDHVAGLAGAGSQGARADALRELLAAATEPEQDFLRRLVLGELRQGALAGLAAQALAAAFGVPEADVRRALLLHADLGAVAVAARTGGAAALQDFRLELFRPLEPMLAQTSPSLAAALEELGRAAVEVKLDGARFQAHRAGEEVRVYTRNLRDVTARSPEVVAAVRALPVASVVLDGEVLGLRQDGRPQAFQDTMSAFSAEVARAADVALWPFFFDVLHLDGEDLLDRPYTERTAALQRVVPRERRIRQAVLDDLAAGQAFQAAALREGHEGVMVKALDAPYEAGRRGAAWRKVKPVRTLDLVVLAVEWGSGRRRGWLSNLHLGARDPEQGGFVMLGKTFKGLTDAMLEEQTRRLLALETARRDHVVFVRPELVVEIAIDGVQRSSRYPGGVALRFARVKGYRPDKSPAQADTLDTVRAMLGGEEPVDMERE